MLDLENVQCVNYMSLEVLYEYRILRKPSNVFNYLVFGGYFLVKEHDMSITKKVFKLLNPLSHSEIYQSLVFL